ncbi:MAG: glucose-1-phosphate adenylyltransferase subunit GlgD [Eubacteriales bacterium]|nr:glucose-1-phosphate adenylyltransferase subunit GlgD [Eubacteriales bacterium]NLV70262.1 glucose-1-phosphate adenylyltransferase subunit GlgD [Clostridiales bacterium]
MSYMGLIYSYSDRENLRELTSNRALAALSIGGKYRIIDFVLSNFVNSGIFEVSVIARTNYHSLIEHLGSGAEWDMSRKRGGLRVLTPFANKESTDSAQIYKGSIDALANHLHSIKKSMAEYVVLTGSRILYTMDYRDMIKAHLNSGADITIAYTNQMNGTQRIPQGSPMVYLDEQKRVQSVEILDEEQSDREGSWCIDVCVIRKTLLESLIADATSHQRYDLYNDILKRLAPTLKIFGYEYCGHLLEISTISTYMEANRAMLDPEFASKVFQETVYTKVKDSVPALYGPDCYVENSMISDGCQILGTVINSVVSRGVHIDKGAVVKDSIIMQDTEIMDHAKVEHAILDKDVIVRDGREVIGHPSYPIVLPKMSIV